MSILIDSKIATLPYHLPEFTQDDVKREPMLFNCDISGALRLGGPVTKTFLNQLPDDFIY